MWNQLCPKKLTFDLGNVEFFNMIAYTIYKTNYLIWTGPRHLLPFDLRQTGSAFDNRPSFNISSGLFAVTKKRPKDCYSMLVPKSKYRIILRD